MRGEGKRSIHGRGLEGHVTTVENPEETGDALPETPWSDQDFTTVLEIAYQQAKRHGIPWEERDDCALSFLVRFSRLREQPGYQARWSQLTTTFRPWIYRCAANHARNYLGKLRWHQSRQVVLAEGLFLSLDTGCPSEEPSAGTLQASSDECPQARLFRQELWHHMEDVLERLEPRQHLIFQLYAIEGVPVSLIAAQVGCSSNAVHLSLVRIRRQIIRYLERRGLAEQTLRAWASLAAPEK